MINKKRLKNIEKQLGSPDELWYPESTVLCELMGIKPGEGVPKGKPMSEAEIQEMLKGIRVQLREKPNDEAPIKKD